LIAEFRFTFTQSSLPTKEGHVYYCFGSQDLDGILWDGVYCYTFETKLDKKGEFLAIGSTKP
jgi:hypothetical protein